MHVSIRYINTSPYLSYLNIYLKAALACVCNKFGNGMSYVGEILHAVLCGACNGHGLGLLSIGVVIGKKIVL